MNIPQTLGQTSSLLIMRPGNLWWPQNFLLFHFVWNSAPPAALSWGSTDSAVKMPPTAAGTPLPSAPGFSLEVSHKKRVCISVLNREGFFVVVVVVFNPSQNLNIYFTADQITGYYKKTLPVWQRANVAE